MIRVEPQRFEAVGDRLVETSEAVVRNAEVVVRAPVAWVRPLPELEHVRVTLIRAGPQALAAVDVQPLELADTIAAGVGFPRGRLHFIPLAQIRVRRRQSRVR